MTKKNILFYTDCPVFGGCEKPIFEVLSSDEFASRYDFTVVFRQTKEYLDGLSLFWPSFPRDKLSGVRLFDINSAGYYLQGKITNPVFLKIARKSITLAFNIMKPFMFVLDIMALSSIFRNKRADIIHINNGGYPGMLSCRAAAIAAKAAGIKKVIFSVHNMAFKNRGFVDGLIDPFVKRSVDVVVTGSKASARALAENRGFDRDKIITIYHGVDAGAGKPGPGNPASGEIAGLGEYILMIARFEERKGHKYLLQAFKKIISENASFADLKLALIGDGPILTDIKRLVASERLGKNVRFLGHKEDYMDYVASSLFLLNPSIGSEDLPYIILEAMSLGVPVIGTDIAGIPEEIVNGVTGIVVPPKDAAALEKAILDLLSDRDKRVRMGSAGLEIFNKSFTMDRMVKDYLALYERSAA